VLKVPEARMLMVSLAATATAEGVRSSLLTARDMLLGQADSGVGVNGTRHMWQLPVRQLYVLLCIIFSILLYYRSRLDTVGICT
jgi:hypothetical protein